VPVAARKWNLHDGIRGLVAGAGLAAGVHRTMPLIAPGDGIEAAEGSLSAGSLVVIGEITGQFTRTERIVRPRV
jgi:hypothetical protein